jgi:hypothetical protein
MHKRSFLRDAEETLRAAVTEFDGAIRHGRIESAPSIRNELVERSAPPRTGGPWESVARLKPLVLAVVFVLVIAGELAREMNGLSAGSLAVSCTALFALAWEVVARTSRARRRPRARPGS